MVELAMFILCVAGVTGTLAHWFSGVEVVDTDDLVLVDAAVARLAQHRVLGFDVHWNLEEVCLLFNWPQW